MVDTKLKIEIALRSGRVAKAALEFCDYEYDNLLLKLKFKGLIEEVKLLEEAIKKVSE